MVPVNGPAGDVFVGREFEIRVVRGAIEDVLAGRGRVVLISGEPGIGKTRLCEELTRQASERAATVLWGRCYEGEGAPALWPWIQVLRGCLPIVAPQTQGEEGLWNDELGRLTSGWYPSPNDAAAAVAFESPQARFRLFDCVTQLLVAVAERAPLILLFDDLHSADSASLLLLQFVAQGIRDAPLLIVATYRDVAAESNAHLSDTITALLRVSGNERLALKGLTAAEIATLIECQTGVVPQADLVAALRQRTDGNTLFVTEFVRSLRDEGRLTSAGELVDALPSLPERVRSLIVRRLAPLSTECRELVGVAAAVGHEAPLAVIASVLESRHGPGGGGTGWAPLAEAYRAGILAAVPETAERARFSHVLIRDVVYDELLPSQREALHRAVATAMEALPDRDEHLAEIAVHFSRAGSGAPQVKALHYAQAAAAQAAARTAYEEAARLYELALRLNGQIVPLDEHRRCDLLLGLGAVHQAGGTCAAARIAFERAAECARGLPAGADCLARAAIGYAGGWAGLGNVGQFQADRAQVFDAAAVNLLEEALAAQGNCVSALRACVLSQLAVQRHFIASRPERVALSHQAVELARRVGDPATLGYVRCVDWVVGWSPDNPDERLAAADEIIACAQQAGDRSLAIGGRFQRIAALLELGAGEDVQRERAEVGRLADALRQPQWLWRVRAHDIMLALVEGRFDAARELLEVARRDRRYDDSTTRVFYALQMTALHREVGQRKGLESAAAFLKAAVDQYPTVPSLRTRLAYLYAELEQVDLAARELAYAAANDFTDFARDLTWLNAMAEAAESCAAVADRQHAARLYDLLLPYAAHHVVFLGGALSWGSVSRLLGRLATVLDRGDEAAAHFEAALATNRRLGARVWVAHTQSDYGAMLLQRRAPGDVELAGYCLEQALFTAQTVGMQPLASRVQAMLAAAQRDAIRAGPERSAAAPAPEKTGTNEQEILLYREADFWTITRDGRTVRLRDAKGLQFLHRLVRHPGREFHALDLILDSAAHGAVDGPTIVADDLPGKRALLAADAGELLDPKAKAAYRERVKELQDELAQAESDNDLGRCERLREEMDAILTQLSAAVGLGGRDRRAGAAAERARLAVTKRIHDVVRRLHREDSVLADHLRARIKTGYFCVYLPDPERPLTWVFAPRDDSPQRR